MYSIEQSYWERILKGVTWSLIGNILWRALTAISMIFVARILGNEAFGELGMVRSTIDIFTVFASFRLGTTATKYVAQFREKDPLRAGKVLKLTLLISFVTCLLASIICLYMSDYLAHNILDRKEISPLIALGAIFAFSYTFGMVLEFALAGFEAFKSIAKVNVLRGILALLITLPMAHFFKVEGVLVGLIFNSFVVLVIFLILLGKEREVFSLPQNIPIKSLQTEISVLWKFALPGFLSGIIFVSSFWLGRVMLVNIENGYQELGFFTAANQWRALILFFPAIIGRVILPVLSESYKNRPLDDFAQLVESNIFSIWSFTLPITILVITFSEQLASVFGKDFSGTESIIPLLLASVFFYCVTMTVNQALDGAGKRWQSFSLNLLWAMVFLATNMLVIQRLAAIGFALSYLISYVFLIGIQLLYLDIFLTKRILRRNMKICLFSLLLITTCLFSNYFIREPLSITLQLLSFLGSLMLLKNYFNNLKRTKVNNT